MKLFVTGGTGFVGSHFINQAHKDGHRLVCLRRKDSLPRISLTSDPSWVEGSLDEQWADEMRGCDVLVHLASHSTNVPYDTLENCLYWNLTASMNLLKQAQEAGIYKFVIAGTGFEYGLSGERFDYIPTDAPLEPTLTYPASKAAAAIVFLQWAIENKLLLQYLRIFQVYGEGEPENRLWPSLCKAAVDGEDFHMTAGEQIRDFTPVEEVARQLVNALGFSAVGKGNPHIGHIGTGVAQSLCQFTEYWWDKMNAKGHLYFGTKPYRENEVMRYVPEMS